MGVDITTSWIIHIWIRQLIVCVCAQVGLEASFYYRYMNYIGL
uniref:Uncharacterized protein n=1 Tax=Anguilla anguilla TaxID=7936 RepID=A0A0E9S9T5_ANGAN